MNYFLIYAIASIVLATFYILIRFKKIKGTITGNPFWSTGKTVLFSKVSKVALVLIIFFAIVLYLVACPILVPFFIIKKIRSLFKKKEVKPTGYGSVPKFFTEADNSVGPIDLNMD
jgi:hypothetical protein